MRVLSLGLNRQLKILNIYETLLAKNKTVSPPHPPPSPSVVELRDADLLCEDISHEGSAPQMSISFV